MQKIRAGTANAYAGMVGSFSDSILKNTPAPISLAESRGNLILIEKIQHGLKIEMSDRIALYPKINRKFGGILSAFSKETIRNEKFKRQVQHNSPVL
jgi:hypothetical protein